MMTSATLFKDDKRLGILDGVPEDVEAIVWGGAVFVFRGWLMKEGTAAFRSVESYHTNQKLREKEETKP